MIVTQSITLTERRHWDCGRWYAYEATGPSSRCPYCAEADAYKKQAEAVHLGRVIRSLRGALTKARTK